MPRRLRRDAVLAGARFVTAMQDLWLRHEAEGDDLAVTVGEFMTDPAHHSFSKIAGDAQLCLDVRSLSEDVLAAVRAGCAALAQRLGEENSVSFELGPLSGSVPAPMSQRLIGMLADAAAGLGLQLPRMPSGAGHDAATFSQAGIPSAMLFIRNENGSHNPLEAMAMADFRKALEVLHAMLMLPAGRWLERQDEHE
jgi:N-carbamoyl-L-amino-acid hydrolase